MDDTHKESKEWFAALRKRIHDRTEQETRFFSYRDMPAEVLKCGHVDLKRVGGKPFLTAKDIVLLREMKVGL